MKKLFLALILGFSVELTNAQVFYTGQTLKPGRFSLRIEPTLLIDEGYDFMLLLHGGYEIKSGIDFGLLRGNTYVGGDVEYAISKYMSFSAGAHHRGNFGLDAPLLGTFPPRTDLYLFSGLDSDINFLRYDKDNDGDKDIYTQFLLWLPVGVKVGFRSNLALIFEACVG